MIPRVYLIRKYVYQTQAFFCISYTFLHRGLNKLANFNIWYLFILQLRFYGFYAWSMIQRICLPLRIFFRFHSSVILVEIWKNSVLIFLANFHHFSVHEIGKSRFLEGNQNKNNCLVRNLYEKLKSPTLFSHLLSAEKSTENFNLL